MYEYHGNKGSRRQQEIKKPLTLYRAGGFLFISCRRYQTDHLQIYSGGVRILNVQLGVTVTVPNDSLAEVDPGYAKGAVVTLKGEDTEQFVRYRNTEISQSAIARMERQQEYIRAFGEALKKASADKALVTDLYKAIEPYMVTNMGKSRFVDLTESVSEGKKVNRWTIPGEGIQGKEYDEYVVDDDALYEKTVETFYVEKK